MHASTGVAKQFTGSLARVRWARYESMRGGRAGTRADAAAAEAVAFAVAAG